MRKFENTELNATVTFQQMARGIRQELCNEEGELFVTHHMGAGITMNSVINSWFTVHRGWVEVTPEPW